MARPATAAVRLLTGEREPVRLATTANISLYGLQTIDAVLTEVGDRVLVKDQSDGSQNGIYTASAGNWYRAADARSSRTMQKGTTVRVQEGAVATDHVFIFESLAPTVGTDPIVITVEPPSLTSADILDEDDMASNSATRAPSQQSAKVYFAPKASPTFTGAVTLGQDPAAALQAATKQYVDNLALNVGKRGRVRVASTANITLSAPGSTIDGIAMSAGNTFLAKDQSAPAENGIYVWNGSAVAATRSSEFDTYDEHPGSLIAVQVGTVNADTLWLCTSNEGGTLGSTAIAFSGVGIALLDGSVTYAKIASAALATASDYRTGTATGKILTVDQVNSAMAEATLTDASTIAWDMSTGFDFTVTLTASRTLGNPTNTVVGRRGRIRVVQNGTGGWTLTKSSNHKTAGGSALSIASAAGAETYLYYDCVSSTKILLSNSPLAWS